MSSLCCEASECGQDCLQLTVREAEVCEAICGSPQPLAFSALMTKLGLHQEITSRILKRLQNYGAIEKTPSGYRSVNN